MKATKITIFLCLLSCGVFCGKTRGVEIKPSIVLMPGSPDELFSFDLMISEEPSISAQGFQATIDSITGPVGFVLTFDIPSSEAVSGETTAYWVYRNSAGATAIDNGDYSYTFGDWPDNGNAEPLVIDDIMARYAFIWDGTEGNYTFTFDLGTGMSYILLDDLVSKEALQLPTGPWYDYPIISADSSSFTVHIPEPTTLVLFGLGSLVLLKQRRP
ncbi:MAG: PEP-CTERM sorting domain-containing protein [Planctomycetota bacterium]